MNDLRENAGSIQTSLAHLTKCLTLLEKIKGIAGDGPIAKLCDDAINNRPLRAGGLDG